MFSSKKIVDYGKKTETFILNLTFIIRSWPFMSKSKRILDLWFIYILQTKKKMHYSIWTRLTLDSFKDLLRVKEINKIILHFTKAGEFFSIIAVLLSCGKTPSVNLLLFAQFSKKKGKHNILAWRKKAIFLPLTAALIAFENRESWKWYGANEEKWNWMPKQMVLDL